MYTRNTLREGFENSIIDTIDEIIHWEFDNFKDNEDDKSQRISDVEDLLHDTYLHQLIDGSQEVIYTHQAKAVCDALDIDIFGESEMTGERYESWSHAAYDGIYSMIFEDIDFDELINNAILKLNK